MLLIIVPVMALTVLFAWRYRAGNDQARYEPEWHHSTQLELVIWSAPLVIIIALGSVTWVGTHLLDPFRPLSRVSAEEKLAPGVKPLEVEVVALDWKWLFIYPEQKVASVNELALPTGRPIHFRITSANVMNSFFVPAMAGQIYAMPGMTSQLNAVLNKSGTFNGFSANYSGAGFSQMHFATLGLAPADFDSWVKGASASAAPLDRTTYLQLTEASIADPVRHFGAVVPGLFDAVAGLCVQPGKMCVSEMAAIDARGGTGRVGSVNLAALTYDKTGRPELNPVLASNLKAGDRAFVRALCAQKQDWTPVGAKPAQPTVAAPALVAHAPHSGSSVRWPTLGLAAPTHFPLT